jgi:hypothetical protein
VVASSPAPPPATACGDYPEPLSTTQPNVLLIGDSISMAVPSTPGGYGINARTLLAAQNVTVQHNGGWGKGGQASNTVKGLECTNISTAGNWLNFTGTFDVIHFNFGLHDLVDAGPGEGYGCSGFFVISFRSSMLMDHVLYIVASIIESHVCCLG